MDLGEKQLPCKSSVSTNWVHFCYLTDYVIILEMQITQFH